MLQIFTENDAIPIATYLKTGKKCDKVITQKPAPLLG